MKIAGHTVVLEGDGIRVGCTKVSAEEIENVYQLYKTEVNKKWGNVTIGSVWLHGNEAVIIKQKNETNKNDVEYLLADKDYGAGTKASCLTKKIMEANPHTLSVLREHYKKTYPTKKSIRERNKFYGKTKISDISNVEKVQSKKGEK